MERILQEEYESKKKELEKRIDHIQKSIMYHRLFGMGRLLLAFPEMQHRQYQDMVERIRKMLDEKIKKDENMSK